MKNHCVSVDHFWSILIPIVVENINTIHYQYQKNVQYLSILIVLSINISASLVLMFVIFRAYFSLLVYM